MLSTSGLLGLRAWVGFGVQPPFRSGIDDSGLEGLRGLWSFRGVPDCNYSIVTPKPYSNY